MEPTLKAELDALVTSHKVVLFMKGNRTMPRCGFSATVVGILDGLTDEYETVDVIANPAIRQGIKEYSDWPTLPQLYIDGEFQGGCDIVREMAANGELHSALGVEVEEVPAPNMTLTEAAAKALKEAGAADSGEGIRFKITPDYRYELSLGPKQFGDSELELAGFTFYLDGASAKRGEGTIIDFTSGPMGSGFKISNPDEPAKVQQVPPNIVQAWLAAGEAFEFLDVRTPDERKIAHVEGSVLYDGAEEARLDGLAKDTRMVFVCHHGTRSQRVAERFVGKGFTKVVNLAGGIDAWSIQVDSSVPRY